MMKRLIILLNLLWGATLLNAQSFAIVVDADSYTHCGPQIEAYAASVRADGLEAFVAAGPWETPEAVRDSLRSWHASRALAGTVFIGNIPVPMIRKAQHLTSAFKMDEQNFPMRDSSVPSDRFYDDFDLVFRPVGRDSVETRFFYYELAPESPQEISCDIFSGRIHPSDKFQDRYTELSKYLTKLVRLRAEENELDRVMSYTGEGSFSDSMIAWKDEAVTLAEQVPGAFHDIDGATFFVFYQYPYMKDIVLKECRRDDLDLVLFHCHGTPERQWIQGTPPATCDDEYYAAAKLQARNAVRRKVRFGAEPAAAMAEFMRQHDLDTTWVADTFDPEVVKADSLADLRLGIVLEDVWAAKPNARMYIFDACYNGDFREEDNIASRYIFSDGNAVVSLGNTVNVLQDKASSTYLGLLTQGCTVGEWHRQTAILESHVIGDPAFHFRPTREQVLDPVISPDDDLLDIVRHGKGYMQRHNALTKLKYRDMDSYRAGLRAALEDPYEFTRRKAAYWLCRVGHPDDVPAVLDAYFHDINTKRVAFNICNNSACFPDSTFLKAFDAADKSFLHPGMNDGRQALVSAIGLRDYAAEAIARHGNGSRGRASMLHILRNNPYPQLAPDLVKLVMDETEPLNIRLVVAEALGWFTDAYNRDWIAGQLRDYKANDPALQDEITRTVGRLNVYLR